MFTRSNYFLNKTSVLIVTLFFASSAIAKSTANYPDRRQTTECLSGQLNGAFDMTINDPDLEIDLKETFRLRGDLYNTNEVGVLEQSFEVQQNGLTITRSKSKEFQSPSTELYRAGWYSKNLKKRAVKFSCYYILRTGLTFEESGPVDVGSQTRSLTNPRIETFERSHGSTDTNAFLKFDTIIDKKDAHYVCKIEKHSDDMESWESVKHIQISSLIDAFNQAGIIKEKLCMTADSAEMTIDPSYGTPSAI